MIIALDLDGVVTDIHKAILGSLKLEKSVSDEEIGKALMTPEGSPLVNHIFESEGFWKGLLPIPDSWFAVNNWAYKLNNIHFVTARRSPASIGCIESWLDMWDIPFDQFHVVDMMKKLDVLKEIEADLFIDDNVFEVDNVLKDGSISAIALRHSYNAAVLETHQHIPFEDLLSKVKL